jgi:Ca2+-binding EF-hand superfamily protein
MSQAEISNAFRLFDENGDGLINLEEYIQGCRKNGNSATDESLKEMFDLFDIDHDGNIDEKEFYFASNFLGISKSFVKVGMDEVTAAFQKYDTNGDGLISLEGEFLCRFDD